MGQQCSMCAHASSAGLFPPMGAGDAAAQLPTTGYAYLRIDPALKHLEIALTKQSQDRCS